MVNYYAKINNCFDENIISIEEPITPTKIRKYVAIEISENFTYFNDKLNILTI